MSYIDGIEPATDGRASREQVLNFVMEKYNYGIDAYRTLFKQMEGWYKFYIGNVSANIPIHRHNVHVPLLFGYIWTSVARMVQAVLSQFPYVGFVGGPAEAAPIARKNEQLISLQLDAADIYRKLVDFVLSAHIYGTAFMRYGWSTLEYRRKFRAVNKQTGEYEQLERIVTDFDGPQLENTDILDVIPEPGPKFIEQARWCVFRYYKDLDDLIAENSVEGAPPTFYPDALEELRNTPMDATKVEDMRVRLGAYSTYSQWQQRKLEKFAKPVEIIEFWGRVPQEFAVDGQRDVVITIGNGKVVMRYEPNPHYTGEIPLIVFTPMPDPHRLHGTGKVQVAEKLQAVINKVMNAKLDALELALMPQFLVSEDVNTTSDSWTGRPGKLHKVKGDVRAAAMPLLPDMRGFGMAVQEMDMLGMSIQQALGTQNDTVLGMPTNGRGTAREFMGRQQVAMNRLQLEAILLERYVIEKLAMAFRRMNRQWLTLPRELSYLGTAAVIDPYLGTPIQLDPIEITEDDIDFELSAVARGASRAMTRTMRAQNLMTALPMVGQHPVGLMTTNWMAFFTEFWDALELNPKDMQIAQDIPAINQMAAMGQQSPEQQAMMGGEGGTELEDLSPDQFGPQEGGDIEQIGGTNGAFIG